MMHKHYSFKFIVLSTFLSIISLTSSGKCIENLLDSRTIFRINSAPFFQNEASLSVSWSIPNSSPFIQTYCTLPFSMRAYIEQANFLDVDDFLPFWRADENLSSLVEKPEFAQALHSYKRGDACLEWERGPFFFRQYFMQSCERLTFSVQRIDKKKKSKTYYKQQRYLDKEESLLGEVYCDSYYRIEYWKDNEFWVIELPHEEGGQEIYFPARSKATREIKKPRLKNLYDQAETYCFSEPPHFASPKTRQLIKKIEEQELKADQPSTPIITLFAGLLLSGGIADPLRNSSMIIPQATSSSTTADVSSSTWTLNIANSLIHYTTLACAFLPSKSNFIAVKWAPFTLSLVSSFSTVYAQSLQQHFATLTNLMHAIEERASQELINSQHQTASNGESKKSASETLQAKVEKDRNHLDNFCFINNGFIQFISNMEEIISSNNSLDSNALKDLEIDFKQHKETLTNFIKSQGKGDSDIAKACIPILKANLEYASDLSIIQAIEKLKRSQIKNTAVKSLSYSCNMSQLVEGENEDLTFIEQHLREICNDNNLIVASIYELTKELSSAFTLKSRQQILITLKELGQFYVNLQWKIQNTGIFSDTILESYINKSSKVFIKVYESLLRHASSLELINLSDLQTAFDVNIENIKLYDINCPLYYFSPIEGEEDQNNPGELSFNSQPILF